MNCFFFFYHSAGGVFMAKYFDLLFSNSKGHTGFWNIFLRELIIVCCTALYFKDHFIVDFWNNALRWIIKYSKNPSDFRVAVEKLKLKSFGGPSQQTKTRERSIFVIKVEKMNMISYSSLKSKYLWYGNSGYEVLKLGT